MKRLLLPMFAVLALWSGVADAQRPPEAEIAAKTVRRDVFPRAHVRFPGGVVATPQVEIANFDGFRPVRMDIYAPSRRTRPRPAVLWVHGGGWSRGDSRTSGAYADWPGVLASLAARGFVVAAVDYRLSGEARFPAQIQDVPAAIRHLRTHAVELGIDPDFLRGLDPADEPRWTGPYLQKKLPQDPWGRNYAYRYPGENSEYDLLSMGKDGQPGGEGENAEVTNWN